MAQLATGLTYGRAAYPQKGKTPLCRTNTQQPVPWTRTEYVVDLSTCPPFVADVERAGMMRATADQHEWSAFHAVEQTWSRRGDRSGAS
jgi:hypothetical protein